MYPGEEVAKGLTSLLNCQELSSLGEVCTGTLGNWIVMLDFDNVM